jgi:NAD(P)-dependent dehydrogenase (short-subunit alcohol dehydrogenase family)
LQLLTFPLGSLYHGTKFAVEGLSEALHYELEPLGIRVKIVEPGIIATDFSGRSFDFRQTQELTAYQPVVDKLFSVLGSPEMAAKASPPSRMAHPACAIPPGLIPLPIWRRGPRKMTRPSSAASGYSSAWEGDHAHSPRFSARASSPKRAAKVFRRSQGLVARNGTCRGSLP